MKFVVIGGGIAGLACVRKIREIEKNSEVVMLSEEKRPYPKIILPYLLAGEIKEKDLWLEIPPGVAFIQQRVLKVLPDQNKVITATEEFRFDRLLIASGARAVVPDFEGSTSASVFTMRNLSDVKEIKKRLKKKGQGRTVISGAGPVSIEIGDALWKLGYKPLFLVSSRRILSMILDEDGSKSLMEGLPKGEVEIHFEENIKRVKTRKGEVSVETESGSEFKGDLVVSGKGISPNIEFLSSSTIEISHGVVVDRFLRTNKNGVFAAGDVCEAYDFLEGKGKVNALWPVAIEQGRCAAVNMVNLNVSYKGNTARNIITAFGNTIFTSGLSTGDGLETYQRRESKRYSKISLRNGKLVGVIFINVRIDAGVYLFAIENEIELPGLRDVLLSGGLSYSHLFPFLKQTYLPEIWNKHRR
jgi:NADPH-dependent 2,4-dienoyl-CoA reductase/sulfur reductase-like enzyme